jgi:PPM family protein phosphatase
LNVSNAIKVVRLTDVGMLRDHNEDAVASDMSIGLMLLADGMGGYKAGEVASEIAVLMIAAEINEAMHNKVRKSAAPYTLMESKLLEDAVAKTNAAIHQVSLEQPQCAGMGTTLVASVFADNKIAVGHIGDSRMYRLRGGTLTQLTEDHSLVQEQINAGIITAEQAKLSHNKNLVTRALGIDPEVAVELHEHDVEVGDIYLQCSDGLSDLVEDEEITKILLDANGNISRAATKLVKAANENGGSDNISVVLAIIKKTFIAEKDWVKSFLGSVKTAK